MLLVQSHEGINPSPSIGRFTIFGAKTLQFVTIFSVAMPAIEVLDAGIIRVEFIQPFEQFCRVLALICDQDFVHSSNDLGQK